MDKNTIIKRFRSASDYTRWASDAPCLWKGRIRSRKKGADSVKFTGTRNYQEAYELALYGWKEGCKLLAAEVRVAEVWCEPSEAPKIHYDVAGYYPHPARAAAGDLFSMVSRERPTQLAKPAVKMRVNIAVSSGVRAERIMTFGAALCSYVNVLERCGYPVDISCCWETEAHGKQVSFQFPLKQAGEQFSISSVAFWLAHPSALRRIGLSALERLDVQRWFSEEYGFPTEFTDPGQGVVPFNLGDSSGMLEVDLDRIRRRHMGNLPLGSPLRALLITGLRV